MKQFLIYLLLLYAPLLVAQEIIEPYEMGDEAARGKINRNVDTAYIDIANLELEDDTLYILIDSLYNIIDPTDSSGVFTALEVAIIDSLTFENGAAIDNEDTDTLALTETVVKVDGDLYVSGYIFNSCCGGLMYVSTPGTMTINTGGTFEKLDEGNIVYTPDHLYNFAHDDGRLTYTGIHTSHFTIRATVSLESGETAQEIQLRLAKNGTTIVGTTMTRTFVAQSTDTAIPLSWLDELATNDYYEVYGTSDTNADEFDINNLTLTITKH